jgi:hypothetical protein
LAFDALTKCYGADQQTQQRSRAGSGAGGVVMRSV